ncbi:DNA polymerase/3'-5' exonuclease PolX [Methanolobus bombayensis]|uniref:DNA polymerase/3'-5' exonuclease PolX n=1 Tax=Methanolobus bombayensis TaxID=38023 RepID=UPI001AEB57EC|nr:DNA polymerase/3'-5' exonuclease PolX [Methanolobus bombayensis]MBP1909789.1 DNA polymerase (family 10) [Methanolobus bombayensis]
MDNIRIAEKFNHMAKILEFKGESQFKTRAYTNAARTIKGLDEELLVLHKEGTIENIPGIGKILSSKIVEMLETGTFEAYERTKDEIPAGIIEIMNIPGIGPKTARLFYKKLGVQTLDELSRAAREHRIRRLPRMGEKQEEKILRSIVRQKKDKDHGRHPFVLAKDIAAEIRDFLDLSPDIEKVAIAGSLRRKQDTIGDIDIIAISEEPKKAISYFTGMEKVEEVLESGTTKASIIYPGNYHVDLRVVNRDSYGSMLQYFTGSKEHNIHLRKLALSKGYSLNEYGLTDEKTGELTKFSSEENLYNELGLGYLPPELREDRGEVETSLRGKLPRLIERKDIKGDFHVHSNWSDGANTMEELAEAAIQKGYEYIAITDHSYSTGVANGLSDKRLLEHIDAIDKLNEKYNDIRILSGTECDIKANGKLDYSNDLLEQLDIVIVAVHAGLDQDRKKITKRIVSALENEHVDIMAHPTGRKFGKRPPYDMDMETIIQAAKDNEKVLEINSSPWRLDLNDVNAKKAKEHGVMLAINTDTHIIDHMDNIAYGINIARRAWIESDDVLNTMKLKKICSRLGISKE